MWSLNCDYRYYLQDIICASHIPCLADILVLFSYACKIVSDSCKHLTFGSHISSSTFWSLMSSFFSRYFCFCKCLWGFKWYLQVCKLGNHICHLSSMIAEVFLVWQACFCECLWPVQWYSKVFYIWQLYFFFNISDHSHIPWLTVIYPFANDYEVLSDIKKYSTICNYLYSFMSMITYSFMAISDFAG